MQVPGAVSALICVHCRILAGVSGMRIGVPKEIKVHEYRVGLTPASGAELIRDGHEVVVESSAGAGIGF